MLTGRAILIAEDETFTALDLAASVEDDGATVIGPADAVAEGIAMIDRCTPSAAILDANLLDCHITRLALILIDAGIPFVIYTGTGLPEKLAEAHPDLPLVMKPGRTAEVVAVLEARFRD